MFLGFNAKFRTKCAGGGFTYRFKVIYLYQMRAFLTLEFMGLGAGGMENVISDPFQDTNRLSMP